VSATVTRGLSPLRSVLDNGAVIIAQETISAPAVTISASFLSGGIYEPVDRNGVAYLTAKVLDRGTELRSGDVIAEELDDRGVSLKVSTSRHTMTVTATCLAEDFPEVFAIVADVARRPTFPQLEINKRRAEVITALHQDEDNPAVRAVETLYRRLYGPDHPYGRPAKGTVGSLGRITRDDIAAFHARHFRPSVLSLVVVGDVRPAEVLRRAAAELGDWNGGPGVTMTVPAAPPATARRQESIVMAGKSQSDIAYGFTTIGRLDPRYYAYWMMNNILGEFGLGGRLADNIRERQGMAYYAFSTFDPAAGPGPLVVRAGVDPHDVDRALEAIDLEVGRLGVEGPTAIEVQETREYLIGSIPRLFETNQSIATFLQTVEHFGLGLDYDRRLPGYLDAVTIEDIGAAAAEVLHPARAAVVTAGPSGPA
jgi:zinc protease